MTNLKEKTELTQEYVKSLFVYKDGFLYWKVDAKKGKTKTGDLAGTIVRKYRDRRAIKFGGKVYYNYRLIFLWHHGYMPKFVDHINHETLDDRIENLRSVTKQENSWNGKSHIGSTSKYRGVSWDKVNSKWSVVICVNRKNIYLGRFKDETEGALVYNEAAKKHHGEFACLNVIE